MEKFCVYCGKPIEENAKFCPFCGKPAAVQEEQPEPGSAANTGARGAGIPRRRLYRRGGETVSCTAR